jgi:ubiquinol-cytochrome c reductase cytochrome b/c1 subunit
MPSNTARTVRPRNLVSALLVAIAIVGGAALAPALAAGDAATPPRQTWSFAGMFGRYDNAQLQRGFKVYQNVCAACHTMSLLSFRNLSERGGAEFHPEQVKTIANDWIIKVKDVNDQGEPTERAPRPTDRFPPIHPNEAVARAANGGALPPDFSVLVKARTYTVGFPGFVIDALPGITYQEHGADYIYALLSLGYVDPPAGKVIEPGLTYNKYMPGEKIAMVAPLVDGQVPYTDGSPETVSQYAKDVVAFMMWAAEPKLEERKQMGFRVLLFLVVFAGLLYYTKKKVWSDVKGYGPSASAH